MKRILEALQLDKIAAVDRPCQEGATVCLMKRQFTDDERKDLAEKGHAMPDGSYPIANTTDLSNAIQAIGRAPNYHAVRRHIVSRAKALGAEGSLPEQWGVKKLRELETQFWLTKVAFLQRSVIDLISKKNERAARGNARKHGKLAANNTPGPQKSLHRQASIKFKEAAGHYHTGNHVAGQRAFQHATRMATRAYATD
jgi:hypothetical protein